MSGLLVFSDLKTALDAGFRVTDRYDGGYIVEKQTAVGIMRALVDLKPKDINAERR